MKEEEGVRLLEDGTFKVGAARLAVGDYVFLLPDTFDQMPDAIRDDREAIPDYAAKSRHVKVLTLHPRPVRAHPGPLSLTLPPSYAMTRQCTISTPGWRSRPCCMFRAIS